MKISDAGYQSWRFVFVTSQCRQDKAPIWKSNNKGQKKQIRLCKYFGPIVRCNVCEKVILEKRKLNRQTVWGMITAMITSFFSRYPICAQWQIFCVCVIRAPCDPFLVYFFAFIGFLNQQTKHFLWVQALFAFIVFLKKKVVRPKHFFFVFW